MENLAVTVLSVEDNPGDIRLLQEVLKDIKYIQFEWVSVINLTEAIEKVAKSSFDVILLDLSLPDSSGLQTLITIKPHAKGTPIVIMSGLDNEKVALESLDLGAQDYLVKGQVDGNTFARSIRYAIHRRQIQEALQESQERYALAVQGSNSGVWDWDLKMDQVYYSSRWKEILGYTGNEIGNAPNEWMDRIHREDVAMVKDAIEKHLKNLSPHIKVEYRIIDKNGDWRWVLTQGLALRDADGKVYRMAGSQTDVTDRKMAEEKLIHNAFHDALTGLPSRLLLMNRLALNIERLNRFPDYCFAVLFLDLDRFKIINDSLGHILGDQLLVEVSRRFQASVRGIDTITLARVGGDEFIILTDQIKGAMDAVTIADRIRMELESPFNLEGFEVYTRASIGIAFSNAAYKKPEEMIRDADTAMYRAKNLGGGCHQLFDQDMHIKAMAILELENNLRRAVKHNDFILHYQPIVSLTNGRIVGVEALIRWPYGDKGFIPPSEFINLAEETGLIITMGEWVMKTACLQLKQWQQEFPSDPSFSMSVNVSYKQFMRDEFIEIVERILKETGIGQGLCLEITETGIMKNPDVIIPLINRLKALNVQIHLDDFGIGSSSLYYLYQFNIDKLKIDRSFVSHVSSEGKNLEILNAIISLARNLDIEVVAEGIETQVQLKYLRDFNCQWGQGYYFSKPMDKEKVTSLIKNGPIDLEKC